MPISFDIPDEVHSEVEQARYIAEHIMRPLAREMDENEHTMPMRFIEFMWPITQENQRRALERQKSGEVDSTHHPNLTLMLVIEMWSWGDVGIYLCLPAARLGGAAIEAAGTTEQKLHFLRRFAENDEPTWGAMAMTEPGAGSDTSAIQTTAVFDDTTNEWILNGEKIFCTNGQTALEKSNGLVVVWATVDRQAGRSGMKPFVVEAGTPGVRISKVEDKHGIRASNTASIVLENARVPAENILGGAAVKAQTGTKGFQGAMATFDATRPRVAASALGVGRAALEFVKETLEQAGLDIPYSAPYHKLLAVQRDVLEMDAQLRAAYLLTLRAMVMMDEGLPNSLEASMAKVKAGKAVTWVTQKAVELLGNFGYSREWLVEKWMRDGKINDIYEGTGQINTLIVARRILGYSRKELS
jgi:acyl-CoA dehydrogenase